MQTSLTRTNRVKFFSERPEAIRRLILLLYALVGPPFLLVMHVLAKADPLHDVLVVSVFVLVTTGALWVFLRRHPGTWDWIYPVSLSPTVCCCLAFMGSHQQGIAFLVVMIAPMIWAAALFPARVSVVGWCTAVAGIFLASLHTSESYWVSSANALVFGIVCALVAWVVFMKASHLRSVIAKQEEVEQRLRASEESYRNQFTHNSSIMLLIDTRSGAILDANDRAQAFYGYSHEVFVSLNLRQINTMSSDEIRAVMESVPAESGRRFETTHRVSDGTTRSVEVSSSRIQYDGRIAFHAIVTDITALKRTTDRLVSNEENFRTFFNSVEDLIFVADPSGIISFTNDAVVTKLGYSAQELKGMHVLDVRPKELRQEAEVVFAEVFKKSRGSCALPLCRKDGSWLPVETRVWFGEWDGKACVFSLSKDVSKELESQKRVNQIFQTNPAFMAISTIPDRIFIDVNQAFLDVMGYQRDEILGRSAKELGLFVDPEEKAEDGWEPLPTGNHRNLEIKVRAKDGRILYGLFSSQIIESSGQQFFLTVMVDITARKQAEKTLESTVAALNESTATAQSLADQALISSRAKGEFLATMSHEIRTPMNGVIGMTHLLLQTDLTAEQARLAQMLRQSGDALVEIIDDILDYSKIESGKFRLESLDFDLESLMEGFADSLSFRAAEKNLCWTCLVANEVPLALRGDPGRLRQILTNLAGNAMKFTSLGEVAVAVSVCEETPEDVLLRFSVRDTGIGIPADKIDLLFDKFTQVDSSTSRKFGGAGLGLAISKQLATMMGGDIGVKSVEGRGSTFWFTVRFSKQNDLDSRFVSTAEELRGRRILVVDPNPTAREQISNFTLSFGMTPTLVASGPEALQELDGSAGQERVFDFAIVSEEMPHMDGAALARAIRSDRNLDRTKIVEIVSLARLGAVSRPDKPRTEGRLPRPVHRRDLETLLRELVAPTAQEDSGSSRSDGSSAGAFEVAQKRSRQARILLVEDNLINTMVAKGILSKLGYETETAAGGAEALQALAIRPFDLVLLDCQMPEMDGYEVARTIRAGGSGVLDRRVSIVAMTANVMPGDREKCLAAGMDDYIAKPLDPMDVSTKVKHWSGTRSL
ncbi:MAG: PAS domain S-box protein [Fibrobacteres bacterium]|nr:PAS domain S-box protein [Fibrobacterota bacterium]